MHITLASSSVAATQCRRLTGRPFGQVRDSCAGHIWLFPSSSLRKVTTQTHTDHCLVEFEQYWECILCLLMKCRSWLASFAP